jgi:CDP-6-deoxy-D-xylo-4-hexulose-3-dehydrase
VLEEDKIKKQIFKMIEEFYKIKHKKQKFIPEKTKVCYSGRVFDHNELIALTDAILESWFTLGKYGKQFEQTFSNYLKVKHTILTNSGSSANLLAVSSLTSPQLKNRLHKDDEVITTAVTFPTTFNPIIQNNLIPVILDVDLGTYNIQVENLDKALSEKTKLIVIPHTLGNPCEMDTIMDFAETHNLYVIEDSCDALGSKYNGEFVGSIGNLGTFSFYPAHHMTMGEGGAIVTNDDILSPIVRSLRDWGRACVCPTCSDRYDKCPLKFVDRGELPADYDTRYFYTNIGFNLKPTDFQAALGVEQLKKLPNFIEERGKNFKILYQEFLKYEKYFVLPKSLPKSDPSWFALPLTVKKNQKFNRKDIVRWYEKNKIETRLLFAGNILKQPAYKEVKFRLVGGLKNTDDVMKNTFFIGVYPGLDEEKITYILDKTREFMRRI